MSAIQFEKGSKKVLNAWAFYDWANSAYSLVITSAVFPIFYGALFRLAEVESVEFFGVVLERGPLISYVTSAAFVVVALVTSLVSGVADYLGNKKTFMRFFCYAGALCAGSLYFFSLESIYISLGFYFFGLVFYWLSLAMYNSFLPDVAHKNQQDAISAKGFSMGYIGSVLLLVFNLFMVMFPDKVGISGTETQPAEVVAMRYSFITVGMWWALFSQYTFKYLPSGEKKEGERKHIVLGGLRELQSVNREIAQAPFLKKYLKAYFVYSMAVQTILLIAAYFGESEIEWGGDQERTVGLIVSILLIQIVAIIGSVITARLSKRIPNVKLLIYINIFWMLLCVYAYFVVTPNEFYLAAGLVGLVMGSIQTLSRSTYSQYLPDTTDTTSYFSYFEVSEKIGIIIGTFIFGYLAQSTGSMRIAAICMGVFFGIGSILLKSLVNYHKRQELDLF